MSPTTSDVPVKDIEVFPFRVCGSLDWGALFYCYMINYQDFSYNGSKITFSFSEKRIMINATKMAKPFGKYPKDWLRPNATEEFLKALSSVKQFPFGSAFINRELAIAGKYGRKK